MNNYNKFLGQWDDIIEVARSYDVPLDTFDEYNVIVANYQYGNYEGDAYILLEKDGEYFESFGSHCSCYGLEGQFDLEKVTEHELHYRMINGSGDRSFFLTETLQALLTYFNWA